MVKIKVEKVMLELPSCVWISFEVLIIEDQYVPILLSIITKGSPSPQHWMDEEKRTNGWITTEIFHSTLYPSYQTDIMIVNSKNEIGAKNKINILTSFTYFSVNRGVTASLWRITHYCGKQCRLGQLQASMASVLQVLNFTLGQRTWTKWLVH